MNPVDLTPADAVAEPLAAVLARCAALAGDGEDFAARLRAMHMPVGATIRWTEAFWQGADEVVCRFRAPRPEERAGAFAAGLHPGALDGAIQPLFLLLEGAAALFQKHRLLDADDPAASPELLRVTLPTLLADGRLVAGYRGGEGEPLPVPITAFAGTDDRWIEPAAMAPWRRHTSRAFSLRPVAGGHLVLRDEAALREVLAEVARSLAAHEPRGAGEAVGA